MIQNLKSSLKTGQVSQYSLYTPVGWVLVNSINHFIISINDHPDIREVFEGFEQREIDIKYRVGGNVNAVERRELLILG